jgi:uncharacterized membrane protein YkoI
MAGRRLALAFALALLAATTVRAADDAARARAGVAEKRLVPLASILDWIEARYRGEAIEIELEDDEAGEPPRYEVEWLTPDGHVVELEFDARDGRLLEWDGRGLEDARR